MLKAYLAKGRQAAASCSIPVLKADQPQPAGLQALLKDWGIDGRQRRRPRRQRHGPPARHRRVGAGRGQLSGAPDHRELQPADRLPAGALDDAGRRRRQRPHRAAAGRDQQEQLGRNQPQEPDRRPAGEAWTTTDKKGPVSLAAAVSASGRRRATAGRRTRRTDGDDPKPAETRIVAFGDSDFASNGALGVSGQPRPVPEHGQLARAAGEPDLDPAARIPRIAASR